MGRTLRHAMPAVWGLIIAGLPTVVWAAGLYERLHYGTVFADAEKALHLVFGNSLAQVPQEDVSRAIVALAEGLPPGGAIDLPQSVASGGLDFRNVADGVQITGGWGGRLILGPGQRDLQMIGVCLDQKIASAADTAAERGAARTARSDARYETVAIMDPKVKPASDLLALFCEGSIQIAGDVRHCAWIAGANAFGRKTVTADARVDDCLFLWFGINWPFQDYNAHWDAKNAGRNWLDNAQLWFNCKGGGLGTRLYLMVETNYGNPGPGVVLENCEGMALYNGTTERASSQGPGVYWLKNCRKVQVGLRGINAFCPPGNRGPDPSHDITIEGGSGNILHAIRFWGQASGATAVNSDPDLQVWMTSFEFETEGMEGDRVLRYAYTPMNNAPSEALLAKVRPDPHARAEKIVRDRKQEATPERVAAIEKLILAGRTLEAPYTAAHEQTFVFAGQDLTKGPKALPGGRKLPPPPSVPPANAPRQRRELAFTQAADFGKALLEAGADPTGAKPSDDAFARVMFGMTRAEVEALYQEMVKAGAEYEAAHGLKNSEAEKAALGRVRGALDRLWPMEGDADKKGRRVARPRVEIPAGMFLITRPILVLTNGWFVGAGPEKTILKAASDDFAVVRDIVPGTVANFAVDGGRTGLAITGADHDSALPAPLKSYVAGGNFYRLTFRNQKFAGLHLGSDDPSVLGGAEFDQNRFVDLRFENTGDYGIYDNGHMIDKWLCLNGHFEGQKKAGVAMKFTCVIKGGLYGCTFKDIQGPAIDFMGGAPQYAYRPGIVTVDGCEFLECGSADAAAVDLGYAELAMLTHSRIETRGKTIKTGCLAAAQIYEDLDVNVKVPEGAPAMVLRAVRNGNTARAGGHTLRDIRAGGPIAFINDANAYNDFFEPTRMKRGISKGKDIQWDANPAAHESAPPNSWVHPFILYRCTFGPKTYAYSLLNMDPAKGQVLKEVDLSPLSQ